MQITDILRGVESIALVSLLISVALLFVVAIGYTFKRMFSFAGTLFQNFARLAKMMFDALQKQRN